VLGYKKRKFLIILISPSAGGKSTIASILLKDKNRFAYSISYTTRPPRGIEKNGIDYNFVSISEFDKLNQDGLLLEHARVHGHWYGTNRKMIQDIIDSGKHVVLDIDVQGALQIIKSGIDAVTIFIIPPTLEVLKERLRKRNTESDEMIQTRLINAKKELEMIEKFQYLVINDHLQTAMNEILSIIEAEENKISRYEDIKNKFYGG